ncbi:MAG TPA: PIN domain-containing protein [Lacipirellulaceae bacterium]|nr:PIN domain-containing protein [Lacipirellulaceae bacterium]
MKQVFADTFYFLALLSQSDTAHERTRRITAGQPSTLVTTAWVLTELANSLAKRDTRAGFLTTFDALASNPSAVIIGHDDRLFEKGFELYRNRPDKDWSLTDCISFVVMNERQITEALTGDHHFEQAGFIAMLKE